MDFASSVSQANISEIAMKPPEGPPSILPPPSYSPPSDKILCMTWKWWYFSQFLSICLTIVLIIACLSTPRWIETGYDSMKIEGGLLSCTNCDAPFSDLSYSEAAESEVCDYFSPDYTGYCDMFKDLKGAGGAFLFFDLVSIVLLLLWTVKLFLLFRGSTLLQSPRWLFYFVSVVAVCSHVLALIIWGGVSSATFQGDCQGWSLDGSKPELCSMDGPALAIAVMVLLLATSVTFWVVYCKAELRANAQNNFHPAEFSTPSPEDNSRQPQFSPAIELDIPSNI